MYPIAEPVSGTWHPAPGVLGTWHLAPRHLAPAPAPKFPFLCIVKVLIVHQHFKIPQFGGAIRSYYLARALVEKGIRVVVVTGDNGPGYRTESVDGIEVHYLPVSYDNRFGFARRILAFYKFAIKAARFSARHRDVDLCYAISTPLTTGVAAMILKRRFNMRYVFVN